MKLCLSLFNEIGNNIPMFVSHCLEKLPPVGFGSMDTSALLRRLEQLSSEVAGLRRVCEAQATVNDNLKAATEAVNQRLSAFVERSASPPASIGLREGASASETRQPAPVLQEMSAARISTPGETSTESSEPQSRTPRSPLWSTMVRKGARKRPTSTRTQQPLQSVVSTRGKQKKPTGIFGTGTESSIPVITTKRVSLFATRFSPDVYADTLRNYLSAKLDNESVSCRKIETASGRFGSFQITADCKEVADLYSPQIWPAGVFVRRYFEPRVPRPSLGIDPSREMLCPENARPN